VRVRLVEMVVVEGDGGVVRCKRPIEKNGSRTDPAMVPFAPAVTAYSSSRLIAKMEMGVAVAIIVLASWLNEKKIPTREAATRSFRSGAIERPTRSAPKTPRRGFT